MQYRFLLLYNWACSYLNISELSVLLFMASSFCIFYLSQMISGSEAETFCCVLRFSALRIACILREFSLHQPWAHQMIWHPFSFHFKFDSLQFLQMLGMKTAGSTILFPFSICRVPPTWFHIAVQQSSVEGFCLAAISSHILEKEFPSARKHRRASPVLFIDW
jgi:hypothetical protein